MIKRARGLLIVLLYFGALSAIGGGVLGVVANRAGVPRVLGVVIGGTQRLAAITTQRRHPYGSIAAIVAGFGMIIWIFVELVITGYSWPQAVYLALGIGELLLSWCSWAY